MEETVEHESELSQNSPLIARYWMHSCSVTLVLFILYEVLIEYDLRTSATPVCEKAPPHTNWSWYTNTAQAGGLLTLVTLLMIKKLRNSVANDTTKCAYLSTFCCVCISSTTSMLTLTSDWGGMCVDVLGVATPAAIWGEWLFCAPLLMFICVSIDDKSCLSGEDLWLVISLFLSIFFGFLIIFRQPVWLGAVWLALSCLFYMVVYRLLFNAHIKLNQIKRMSASQSDKYQRAVELTSRKVNLVGIFAYLMPIYTIVYFLALYKVLTFDQTRVAFQFSDLMTKGLFALFAMDTHLELLHPAIISHLNIMKINEARRGFLKYIFHEVRVPLNSMAMGIEFLCKSDNLDEEEKESLLMMFEASKFMSETLNEVLNMQKIEEGKLELELGPFSLRQSIKTVLRTFQAPLLTNQITMEVAIPDDLPWILIADRSRIEHVIANFLSNAIKFSPRSSTIKLTVTWKPGILFLPHRGEVTLAVTDSGPGMSEEDQEKLFTSFMQVRPGELQQGRGSGVGLFICKQLIHLHGGEVHCVSKLNEGSSFGFTLPCEYSSEILIDEIRSVQEEDPRNVLDGIAPFSLHTMQLQGSRQSGRISHISSSKVALDAIPTLQSATEEDDNAMTTAPIPDDTKLPAPPTQPPTPVGDAQNSDNHNHSKARPAPSISNSENKFDGIILVVDDVMSNRKMLKLLLEKKGVHVEMAEDGRQAFDLYRGNPTRYTMIFMDNMMPNMDGVQTTAALRKEGFDKLIIGLTGCAMDDDMATYSNAGADMVLSKPISAVALENIFTFVQQNGTISQRGMKLVHRPGGLAWISRK